MARSGASNIVGSLMVNQRSLDVLGEATIIFTAIVGVLAVARKRWKAE